MCGRIAHPTRRQGLECHDHRQQIVEVMGDPTGELAETLKPLGIAAALALQRQPDRSTQPSRAVLQNIVVGALPHGSDRHVFPDRAGDDDEGRVQTVLVQQAQGLGAAELRKVPVGQHQVGARGQRRAVRLWGFHPLPLEIEPVALQQVDDQFRVHQTIFDDQDP